jgi:hypothetical protein
MGPWVQTALTLLGRGAVFGTGAAGAYSVMGQGLNGSGPGVDGYGYIPEANIALGGGALSPYGCKPKRRRRKRALTASDRGDIAFIAGLLGPKAGKDFAVIIGAKN